jgi:hypothetical protein
MRLSHNGIFLDTDIPTYLQTTRSRDCANKVTPSNKCESKAQNVHRSNKVWKFLSIFPHRFFISAFADNTI